MQKTMENSHPVTPDQSPEPDGYAANGQKEEEPEECMACAEEIYVPEPEEDFMPVQGVLPEQAKMMNRLMKTYKERENIFTMREAEYRRQKELLSEMFRQLSAEKEQVDKKLEAQQHMAKELDEKEQMLSEWFKEETAARKKLETDKEAFRKEKEEFFQMKMLQTEELKNEKFKVDQEREMYEHRLSVLGLISEKENGEEGKNAFSFFSALIEQPSGKEEVEYYQKESEQWKERARKAEEISRVLQEQVSGREKQVEDQKEQILVLNEQLEENRRVAEQERQLRLDAEKKDPDTDDSDSGRFEEVEPERSNDPEKTESTEENSSETAEPQTIDETLSAKVIQMFLSTRPGWSDYHTEDGKGTEKLYACYKGLDCLFCIADPIRVEVSVARKNQYLLRKTIKRKNKENDGAKYRYKDGKVYAAMEFTQSVNPLVMLMQVETVCRGFKEGGENHER